MKYQIVAVALMLSAGQFCFSVPPPEIGRNINITNSSIPTIHQQNEPILAISPINPANAAMACISWADDPILSHLPTVRTYRSTDTGMSWTDQGALQNPDLANFNASVDPWLAFGKNGTLYCVALWQSRTTNGIFKQSVAFYKSTNGGESFTFVQVIADGRSGPIVYDHPATAVDLISGTVYVTYTGGGKVWITRTTVNDQTFETTSIQDPGNPPQPIGPVVATGPNGEVYVSWLSLLQGQSTADIHVGRSLDGGQTFTDLGPVAPLTLKPDNTLNPNIFIYPVPSMAVDTSGGPNTGKIYVVFMDWLGTHADVKAIIGTPQGGVISWSIHYTVNTVSTGDQFMPAVAVTQEGLVQILFLDRRDDPNNILYHAYLAEPTNDNFNVMRNVQVSEVQADPRATGLTGGTAVFHGDYLASTGVPATVTSLKCLAVWPKDGYGESYHHNKHQDLGGRGYTIVLGRSGYSRGGSPWRECSKKCIPSHAIQHQPQYKYRNCSAES